MAVLAKWPKYLPFFFVIFIQDNVLYILVEFGSDRMGHCESTKNGRTGAHGLNSKFFAKSEVKFGNNKKK